MRIAALNIVFLLALAMAVRAEDPKSCQMPLNLEKLSAKAAEVVDVAMDSQMLQFAGKFLNSKKPDEAQAQKFISNLKNLCVRSFEFDKDAQYATEDLEWLRSQFRAPMWSRMVGVRSKRDRENVDVYFRMERGVVTGMAVIAAEPKELTIVHMDGLLDPSQLGELGGQFGIPEVEIPAKSK